MVLARIKDKGVKAAKSKTTQCNCLFLSISFFLQISIRTNNFITLSFKSGISDFNLEKDLKSFIHFPDSSVYLCVCVCFCHKKPDGNISETKRAIRDLLVSR